MRGLNPRIHDLNLDLLSFKTYCRHSTQTTVIRHNTTVIQHNTTVIQHKHHRHSTRALPSFPRRRESRVEAQGV